MVSRSLRIWFILHFAIDSSVALPLFIFPEKILILFGWSTVDPVSSRLVAAALIAIGTVSLLVQNAEAHVYLALLNLKIIWSLFATSGLLLSLIVSDQGRPPALWVLILVFATFHCVWVYWRFKIGKGIKNES